MRRQINWFFVTFVSIQILFGCGSNGPAQIHYGQDQCDYCNMNIVDQSFGSELVTIKGKTFKFDSIECLAAFNQKSDSETTRNASIWVTDFNQPGKFVRTDSATFVFNELHKSPMGVGLLGFSSVSNANYYIGKNGGKVLSWIETCAMVKSKWNL